MDLLAEGWHRRSRLVAESHSLSASATGELLGPSTGLRTEERAPELLREISSPALRWVSQESVTVRSDLPAMIRGGRLLAGQLLLDVLENGGVPLSKNSMSWSDGTRVQVRRTGKAHRVDAGIFLGGFAPDAYFHHLCERLSKLAMLDLMPDDLAGLPILVPEATLKVKTLVEATRLLAPYQELVPMRRGDEYRVRQAVWIDDPHRWTAGFPGVFTHVEAMRRFRKQILDRLSIVPRIEPGFRLYLCRGDQPRFAQAPEYRARAERAGFRAWSPETVSFADQVAIWSRVEAVTGETGAAWSGILFAPEGARGLVVTDGTASGWPHLSRISGTQTWLTRSLDVEDFARSLGDLLAA